MSVTIIGPDLDVVLGFEDEPRSVYMAEPFMRVCRAEMGAVGDTSEEVTLRFSARESRLHVTIVCGDGPVADFAIDCDDVEHFAVWCKRYLSGGV